MVVVISNRIFVLLVATHSTATERGESESESESKSEGDKNDVATALQWAEKFLDMMSRKKLYIVEAWT